MLLVLYNYCKINNMLKLESYKKYLGLLVITIIAFTRFSYSIPVAFHPDSTKYYVPLQIIYEKNFSWILDVINFSLITRIINYFVQSLSNGATSNIIFYQKILGTISTILFFFVAKKISSNKTAVFISTLIFSLNPLMLFFEQVIMPEALFICESCAISLVLLYFIKSPSLKKALVLGALIGLHILTKETGMFFGIAVIFSLIVNSLTHIKNSKKEFIASLLIGFTAYIIVLPIIIYNLKKHDHFTINQYQSGCASLWFLTEDMLIEKPSSKHTWITKNILDNYNIYKQQYKIPINQKSKDAFEASISNCCVSLRENRFQDLYPQLGIKYSDLNKIVFDYYFSTLINNPNKSVLKFIHNLKNLLFDKNLYLKHLRPSRRSNTDYESSFFTMIPYSINSTIDPLLKNALVIDTSYIDENQIYTDPSHRQVLKGYFPLMINMDTNKIVLYPEKGFSLWLQKTFINLPWMRILLPLFLISLILFLINFKKFFQEKNFLFYCYLIGSFLLFCVLPAMIHSEVRYQLQFTHFILWFILIVFERRKKLTD